MAVKIQLRRDTAANWNSVDPILSVGELGLEIDTGKVKVGNGIDVWTARPYTINTDIVQSIDGGGPNSVYTLAQKISGGTP